MKFANVGPTGFLFEGDSFKPFSSFQAIYFDQLVKESSRRQLDEESCHPMLDCQSTERRAFVLTMEEQDVLRWAKNSSTVNAPRGMDSLQYKKATAVEALVGLLYLTDRYRCLALIEECVDELITY